MDDLRDTRRVAVQALLRKFYKEDPTYVFGAYGNSIFGFYLK
jgi:hypothetical protein